MTFSVTLMEEKMMRYIIAGILVAVIISVVPIWAANYSVGVEMGDWIKYDVFGTVPGLEEYDWVKMEVQSLSGTEITVLATIHYKDGREETNTLSWDVETGREPWIIPADLSKGDAFPFEYATLIVNDTVTRTYAGASRSVNLLNLTEYDIDTEMFAYWDQTTGGLVELFLNKSSSTESWTGGYKAIETNIWAPIIQATAELSSDTLTQGETVTISAVVKDDAGSPIEGATVSARIDDKIVSLSDLGVGNYEGILETTDLPVGTYSIIITVEKAGYESTQTSHILTVETLQLQVTMQLSTDTATKGEVMTVSANVKDLGGNPIEGVTVTVYIGDKALDLLDQGNGNYQATIDTSDVDEGTYIVNILAHKEGCESNQTSQNLTVKAAPETPWMLYGGVAAVIVVVAIVLYLIRKRF